jgi:Z1 domain
MLDPNDLALTLARAQTLKLERHQRTDEKLLEIAEAAAQMLAPTAGVVSADEVFRQLQIEFDTWVPQAVVVSDPRDHEPWLEARKPQITFSYWNRYRTYLQKSLKPGPIEALSDATDQIVGLMEDPRRPGSWSTYGLVYGQVQSGKTANYTGVICKAVDAGYRVVVVLTSQHESLRHQTQERLDREFLGFNSKFTRSSDADSSMIIGVGALGLKSPEFICQAITTRDRDFTAAQFEGTPVNIHDVRILVVAKKNKKILENLADWLRAASRPSTTLKDMPLLLIDDEADYASVDTRRPTTGKGHSDPDHDPTAINRAIRSLLGLFEQKAYVAYTATPFANVFIPHTVDHPELGEDLFPRSFMVALEPPSNYVGPEKVFGLEDPDADEIREPLPVIHPAQDSQAWLPDGHKKGHLPGPVLPASLVEALEAFVICTAVRRTRELEHSIAAGHSTMLIHVTRWTDVQGIVARRVEEYLRGMADAWGDRGSSGSELRARLRSWWDRDYQPTYETLANRDDVSTSVGPRVSWTSVERIIPDVLDDAADGVKRINGSANDVLDYQSSTPVTVVAIGGDKLSRGLTLDGLSVSYYLRASTTYDTLLQMGRWFGYRNGYLDATRLYTTPDLIRYYVHITRASRELLDLTAAVSKSGGTPKHVGLRVLDGVGSLRVTAAAKMRSATVMSVGFSGTRAETLVMLKDAHSMTCNYAKLKNLITQINNYDAVPSERLHGAGRGLYRENVPVQAVLDFLQGFIVSPRVLTANPANLAEYIRAQSAKGELIRWTVAIAAGKSRHQLLAPEAGKLPLIQRTPITGKDRVQATECEVGVLVNPADEALGLSYQRWSGAYEETKAEFRQSGKGKLPKRASGEALRTHRDPAEGLLLIYPIDPTVSGIEADSPDTPIIGYAVSFPKSSTAKPVRYQVNQVYLDELASVVDDPGEDGENDE